MTDREPHKASSAVLAKHLRAGGWGYGRIANIIGRETGRRPSKATVRRWTDPEWAARDKEAARRRNLRLRRERGIRPRYQEPGTEVRELTDDVLLALRVEDGLSYAAISKVVWRFYAVQMTENEARFRLYGLGVQRNPNKARANRAKAAAA